MSNNNINLNVGGSNSVDLKLVTSNNSIRLSFNVQADMYRSVYDTNKNGIVDNAEKVNNHTVETDVPSGAIFTDTVYDDTDVLLAISDKVDKVDGKGLSTNDYTTDEKNKLSGIADNADVSVNPDWNATEGKAEILNKPSEFPPSSHTHDERYYTETEVNNLLALKADITRNLRYWVRPAHFAIKVNAGRFNFSWNNTSGRRWVFPAGTVLYADGTTPISVSTAEKPDVIIANNNSVVHLVCANWQGAYTLNDGDTNANFLGSLADLPPLTYYLDLTNCSLITGSLADLPPLTNALNLANCSLITGSLADLPPLTNALNLNNCSLITGSLADLPPLTDILNLANCSLITGSLADLPPLTNTLYLTNCSLITGSLVDLPPLTDTLYLPNCSLITGSLADLPPLTNYLSLTNCSLITGSLADLPPLTQSLYLTNCSLMTGSYTRVNGNNVPTYTYLDYTGLSATDMDNTLIAYANCTKNNGIFRANGKTRTSASDSAVATLSGRGWSITGITKV